MKTLKIIFWLIVVNLVGCNMGEYASDDGSSDRGPTSSEWREVGEYQLSFSSYPENVLIDGNKIIIAGGWIGFPYGPQHDGHKAFSTVISVIDLESENKTDYPVHSESGHMFDGGTVANGIGRSARTVKIDDGQYLIYGGFQYTQTAYLLDLSQSQVLTYSTILTSEDESEPNSQFVPLDGVDGIATEEGKVVFPANRITIFDTSVSQGFVFSTAMLTLPRANVDARKLPDGRIIFVGGYDPFHTRGVGPEQFRAEIYDPVRDEIKRIADFPEPWSKGERRFLLPGEGGNNLCFGKYKYDQREDAWRAVCNDEIGGDANSSPHLIPQGAQDAQDDEAFGFVGYSENGYAIALSSPFLKDNSRYDESCQCYRYRTQSKIYVFEKKE